MATATSLLTCYKNSSAAADLDTDALAGEDFRLGDLFDCFCGVGEVTNFSGLALFFDGEVFLGEGERLAAALLG